MNISKEQKKRRVATTLRQALRPFVGKNLTRGVISDIGREVLRVTQDLIKSGDL